MRHSLARRLELPKCQARLTVIDCWKTDDSDQCYPVQHHDNNYTVPFSIMWGGGSGGGGLGGTGGIFCLIDCPPFPNLGTWGGHNLCDIFFHNVRYLVMDCATFDALT